MDRPELAQPAAARAFEAGVATVVTDEEASLPLSDKSSLLTRAAEVGVAMAIAEHRIIVRALTAAAVGAPDDRLRVARYVGQEAAARHSSWLHQVFLGLYEDLCRRAETESHQYALHRVRMEVELRSVGATGDLVTLLESWVDAPDWTSTWALAASHAELLSSEIARSCLEVFVRFERDAQSRAAWGQHLEIAERLAELQRSARRVTLAEIEDEHKAIQLVDSFLLDEGADAERLLQVAHQCRAFFKQSGAPWFLTRGLACARRALNASRSADEAHSVALVLLVHMLLDKFEAASSHESVEEAVGYAQRIIDTMEFPGRSAEADALDAAAYVFLVAHRELEHNPSFLEQAILSWRRRALLVADEPLEMMCTFNNLANALGSWFLTVAAERAILWEAVDAARKAVNLGTAEGACPSSVHNTLASWLGIWIAAIDADPQLAREATSQARLALAIAANDDPILPTLHNNLANRLADEVVRLQADPEMLREVVVEARLAVATSLPGDAEVPRRLSNLCAHLRSLYTRLDPSPASLFESIDAGRAAISGTHVDHAERPQRLYDLAASLTVLYDSLQPDVQVLQEAANCLESATESAAVHAAEVPTWLSHLAEVYGQLYYRLRQEHWLRVAIERAELAVELSRDDDPGKTERLRKLADLRGALFKVDGDVDALKSAIAILKSELARQESATILGSLGVWLGVWCSHRPDNKVLDEAIECSRRGLMLGSQIGSEGARLTLGLVGNLHLRFLQSGGSDLAALQEARSCVESRLRDEHLPTRLRVALLQKLADLCADYGPSGADRRFAVLSDLAELIRKGVASSPSETTVLDRLHDSRDLSSQMVEAALAVGRPERGVELLEIVRGLRFGELAMSLHYLLEIARGRDAAVVADYEAQVRRLRLVESLAAASADADAAELRRLRLAVAEAASRVRALPELGDFGSPPSLATIRQGIADGMALVYLVDTNDGLKALVLEKDRELVVVHCPTAPDRVERWVEIGIAHPFGHERSKLLGLAIAGPDARSFNRRIGSELQSMAAELAHDILNPVLALLSERVDEMQIVACGALGAVPFHIAGDNEVVTVDRVSIRYGLTGWRSVAGTKRQGGRMVPACGDAGGLAWTNCEALAIAGLYGESVVWLESADDLLRRLDEFESVHFVGHADVELDPMATHLNVSSDGELLTVAQVGEVPSRLREEFVISACSARTPSAYLPDEMLGFPSALVASGYARVISAPWPIADRVAAIASVRYHERRTKMEDESPARSLAEVQRWLRRATNGSIQRWAASLADRLAAQGAPVPELRLLSLQYRNEPTEEAPFRHPRDWGALVMTGQ